MSNRRCVKIGGGQVDGLWGRAESDTTEATWQQQQQQVDGSYGQ